MIGGPNSAGIPTLEEASVQACQEEIMHALKKYNCQIIYRQEYVNGLPANPGQFQIVKNPPKQQQQ